MPTAPAKKDDERAADAKAAVKDKAADKKAAEQEATITPDQVTIHCPHCQAVIDPPGGGSHTWSQKDLQDEQARQKAAETSKEEVLPPTCPRCAQPYTLNLESITVPEPEPMPNVAGPDEA